jgi:hypothetical protein
MLIKVMSVFRDTLDNSVKVKFFCDLLHTTPLPDYKIPVDMELLTGIWANKVPEEGKWYDVEIVVDNLVWNQNVSQANQNNSSITLDVDNNIVLYGQLDIAESGFVTLKIGHSLLVCNLDGFSKPLRTFVKIRTTKLVLYDTETMKFE